MSSGLTLPPLRTASFHRHCPPPTLLTTDTVQHSKHRVEMLVLVLCSTLSFVSTATVSCFAGTDNSLKRNVRYILLADCAAAFSMVVSLVTILLAKGSNTFGSMKDGDMDSSRYDIALFVASAFNACDTTMQIVSTVLTTALAHKMVAYLKAHRLHKQDTPSLQPHPGWTARMASGDNRAWRALTRSQSSQSLSSWRDQSFLSKLEHDEDDDESGGERGEGQKNRTTSATSHAGGAGAVELGKEEGLLSTPLLVSGAGLAGAVNGGGGGKSVAHRGDEGLSIDSGLSLALMRHETVLWWGLMGSLLFSVIPEIIALAHCFPWASDRDDDEILGELPLILLYGRYAADFGHEPPLCHTVRMFVSFCCVFVSVVFAIVTVRLLMAFRRSTITLTQCGVHLWRYLGADYLSQVHDTPRTVWLKTMLNVSVGYVCIFIISFSSVFVYFDAQIPNYKYFGEWPESLLYWAPYHLHGLLDAVFSFVVAKRLILDQTFIADMFGLPGEWEWLRYSTPSVPFHHPTTPPPHVRPPPHHTPGTSSTRTWMSSC